LHSKAFRRAIMIMRKSDGLYQRKLKPSLDKDVVRAM